ncbi:MAG: hypothetical protein IBJ11_08775 [Phycisphaerales bacterium]|nr:hypothetical protein [Phycisphaerales bacterium]
MIIRPLHDDKLGHATYLIGCPRSGEAAVLDARRDVDQLIDVSRRMNLRLVAAFETHVAGDVLLGTRELARRLGVMVCTSEEGGPDRRPAWPEAETGPDGRPVRHERLRDGSVFRVGGVEILAVHTPGHTPEHLTFVATDRSAGATEPRAVFTGDFLVCGDMGRPDHPSTVPNDSLVRDALARVMFRAVPRFLSLADHVQVWPGRSPAGRWGGPSWSPPSSTVGYERRYNRALRAALGGEQRFVDTMLEEPPEGLLSLPRIERANLRGPEPLHALPSPARLTAGELRSLDPRRAAVLDTRPWSVYRSAHLPGALFAPMDATFPFVASSFVGAQQPVYLIVEPDQLDEAVRDLVRLGLDTVAGWTAPADLVGHESAGELAAIEDADANDAIELLDSRGVWVLDIRRRGEFAEARIPGSVNVPSEELPSRLDELPRDRRILVTCRSGLRSARSAAYLKRMGFDVINLAGGLTAWESALATLER